MPRADHSASTRKLALRLVQKKGTAQNLQILTYQLDPFKGAGHLACRPYDRLISRKSEGGKNQQQQENRHHFEQREGPSRSSVRDGNLVSIGSESGGFHMTSGCGQVSDATIPLTHHRPFRDRCPLRLVHGTLRLKYPDHSFDLFEVDQITAVFARELHFEPATHQVVSGAYFFRN